MGVVLTEETMGLIARFEQLTGASSRDVVKDDDNERYIFIVNPGEMGHAIGKKGVNIKKASDSLGRRCEAVEYADDPAQFLRNCFLPANVSEVQFSDYDGGVIAHVMVHAEERGIAIGKGGKNISKTKQLALRLHNIQEVYLE
jgi:N utilization substance protein A